MGKQYRHLSVEDRAVILIGNSGNESMRSMARTLGRSASTISREFKRNEVSGVAGTGVRCVRHYDATSSSEAYRVRRLRSGRKLRLVVGTLLFQQVYDRLVYKRWSPQQIAATLRRMHPEDASKWISHETIYAAIYAHPRGALKKGMVDALRQGKESRGLRRTTLAKGQTVPEAMRIVHRPEEIEQRLLPGHWEADFIKGSFNRSGVGTVVERKTRFVVL